MENKIATFDNTVGILSKAWLNGTLLKGDCHACAVGNLCANALGFQLDVRWYQHRQASPYHMRASAIWRGPDAKYRTPEWTSLFYTVDNKQVQTFSFAEAEEHDGFTSEEDFALGQYQLGATGYTAKDLARIEFAFETAAEGYTEEAEYAGLMAVVDVLADIHGIDLSATEAAKQLFVRA